MARSSLGPVIHLPRLFPLQRQIRDHPAKRKVLNAGRRFGKTTLAASTAVEALLLGKIVTYVAPVNKQTDAFWKKCNHYLREPINIKVIERNKTRRTLTLGHGEISCQTAHDADTIRSGDADLLIMDENAYIDPTAWDKVGAPMLLDRNGDAWFISTPNRRNHHFEMFQRGVEDGVVWKAWQCSSYDNPHLPLAALEQMMTDMTQDAIRQEIYAEFLEGSGAVFRNIDACLHAPAQAVYADHATHRIVLGMDWGKQNDFTVISIGCADCHVEVLLDRFNQIDYQVQYKKAARWFGVWSVSVGLIEHNSIGDPGFTDLQRRGLPVMAFDTTASTKPPLIENLALALEQAEWQFLADPIAKGELQAYERKVSALTGRSSYSAPEGMHDDTVMARALMLRAAGRGVSEAELGRLREGTVASQGLGDDLIAFMKQSGMKID